MLQRRNDHPNLYACECSRLIKREQCISVTTAVGGVVVEYYCCCRGPGVHTMETDFRTQAFYAMCGVGAVLPFENPYALRPIPDDHYDLVRFNAGLHYVDSVEDLREFWGSSA